MSTHWGEEEEADRQPRLAANFLWGRLSDKIGRKPVILTGTLLTAVCFLAFGFCRTLWQAIIVQAIMGFGNGNAGLCFTMCSGGSQY